MLFSYYLYPVFTIFVLSFVQVTDSKTKATPTSKPEKIMDDITTFKPNTYCKMQANRFRCGRSQRSIFKYYYDTERNTCEPFEYGNCFHPYNVFSTLHWCKSECKGRINPKVYRKLCREHRAEMNLIPTLTNITENIFCRLQPEYGRCNSYYPRWYYDISEMTCRGFSYSGCGGNQNNFDHAHKCLDVCANSIRQCKLPSPEKPKEILSCYT